MLFILRLPATLASNPLARPVVPLSCHRKSPTSSEIQPPAYLFSTFETLNVCPSKQPTISNPREFKSISRQKSPENFSLTSTPSSVNPAICWDSMTWICKRVLCSSKNSLISYSDAYGCNQSTWHIPNCLGSLSLQPINLDPLVQFQNQQSRPFRRNNCFAVREA